MRLLLLEDDLLLGEGLRDFLRAEGHVVDWCRTLRETQSLLGEPLDALLVDWQLPDGSGLAWLAARRDRGDATPALMLTARDRVHERVQGLDAGADDYLVKPFALDELLARVRAMLRRHDPDTQQQLRFADVIMDTAGREVRRADRSVELTQLQFDLLERFLRQPRIVLERDRLLEVVWGLDPETASNVVDVYVGYLRTRLEAAGEPRLIQTVRGIGYVLRES